MLVFLLVLWSWFTLSIGNLAQNAVMQIMYLTPSCEKSLLHKRMLRTLSATTQVQTSIPLV